MADPAVHRGDGHGHRAAPLSGDPRARRDPHVLRASHHLGRRQLRLPVGHSRDQRSCRRRRAVARLAAGVLPRDGDGSCAGPVSGHHRLLPGADVGKRQRRRARRGPVAGPHRHGRIGGGGDATAAFQDSQTRPGGRVIPLRRFARGRRGHRGLLQHCADADSAAWALRRSEMPETRVPIITLTTDFGNSDHYVAAVKAAMLTVSTQIAIVDITHEIPAHDVLEAGWVLRNTYAAFPKWTVHLAVVDPGVGTSRRPIIAVTETSYFIGPDNGIFSYVFEVEPPVKVIELTAAHYFRAGVSPTFHARDIFGPVAAHLARGIDSSNFGDAVENIVRLDLPRPKVTPEGAIRATVAHVDRFGNVILNVTRSSMESMAQRMKASGFTAVVGTHLSLIHI